jgi:epoxyqueuosine reductase
LGVRRLEQEIREYALEIGFDDVGFTTADPFPQLTEALEERKEGYSWISDGLLQLAHVADPKFVLPSARSIVVLIYDYYKQAYPPEFEGRIGKAYQSRLYPGKKRLFGSRLRLIREFLESKGMEVGVRPAMPERQAAVRAGLGNFGCNTFIYSPGRGSYIGIVAMAVSGELEPTTTQKEHTCPADCNRCVEACPTGALYAPYKMDPLRCIAFNSYGAGNFPGAPEDIPPDIREKMGSWIYGCDHCQDACPHNQARLKQKLVPDAFLQEMVPKFELSVLLNMDDQYFLETVQQLMYGYIWEKKFIQRNAAIALGNSGDEAAVGPLGKALQDQQEMVRKYSAWALGRIGGKKSRVALEKALAGESEAAVTAEIKTALENC